MKMDTHNPANIRNKRDMNGNRNDFPSRPRKAFTEQEVSKQKYFYQIEELLK